MVEDRRFHRKTFSKIENVLRIILDFLIFFLLIIPFYFQWIFKLIFKKKKCIKGKVALVTGGGNGLGKAISLVLASRGCNVVIIDIDMDAAEKTSLEVKKMGLQSKAFKIDITNSKEIFFLRQEIIKEFGGLDILINNAGIISASNFETDSQLESMVKVNLFGTLLITKHFLEHMKERKSGHVVSISSMAGLTPSPYISAYSATKFGVQGFMAALNEHLRLEQLDHCIKTTCIFPYYIKTKSLISDFLDADVRIVPLEVEYAANKVVEAIVREDYMTTIPRYLELMRILQCLPLRVQQLFNDRIKREYRFKNPNFKEEI